MFLDQKQFSISLLNMNVDAFNRIKYLVSIDENHFIVFSAFTKIKQLKTMDMGNQRMSSNIMTGIVKE